WGIHSNMSVTVVYASGTQGAVKMEVGHTVILEKQETPMGEGYALRLVLGKNQYYYSLTDETNVCPDNIFQKGNMMYWFPDGLRGGNFRDEDNSVIQLPSTEKSTLKINVYDGENKVEELILVLEKQGNTCSVELLGDK
ncbi:MAG: hypothetical protein PHX08_15360, partial [Lachnospiraceae bacterium]|nr:hypothetical protein [Lachnospiraceae bacterium]